MAIAEFENNRLFFRWTGAKRWRVEGGGESALGGMWRRGVGLEVGETRAGGGGGFAVEVACWGGHGG